jgi:hypothetical protein
MGDKLKDIVRGYAGYLAVFMICAVYAATSFITIEQTGKSAQDIIRDSALYFALGILINRILDAQGIMIGSRDPRVFETMKLHNEIVDRIYPYMNHLDDWCEDKNAEALQRARRNYLSRFGMRYSDYFEEDGTAKDFLAKESKNIFTCTRELIRYRRFRHAARMKLTLLSPGLLISDAGEAEDPYKMGRSKSEYIKAVTKKDLIMKFMFAFLVGYFSVPSIINFKWANLIWTLFQVGMLIGMGVFSMKTSIIFVTEEYRGRIVKKIDLLMRFEVAMKQEDKEHGRIGQIPNYNPEETEEPAGSLPANQPATKSVGKLEIT